MSDNITRSYRRKGLSESLEEYAARLHLSVSDARPMWRAMGLRQLGLLNTNDLGMIASNCHSFRIAPGLAVPTKPVDDVASYTIN